MSLLEEAEIWASGSRPDSRPCRSEHGASGVGEQRRAEIALTFTFGGGGGTVEGDLTYARAVTHFSHLGAVKLHRRTALPAARALRVSTGPTGRG